MITSTSTALNDLNFIQQFSDQPNIMNDLTVQLMEKYGNRENFLNSVRKEQDSASVQTNLPETEMLNEAKQTFRDVGGDAGIAESMSPQLPEGTRFQDNIGNIGKFIDRSDKKLTKKGKSQRNTDYINVGRVILSSYNLGPTVENADVYIENLRLYDEPLYTELEPMILNTRATKNQQGLKDLTYDEFLSFNDLMESLWYQSLRDQQIKLEGELVQIQPIIDTLNNRQDVIINRSKKLRDRKDNPIGTTQAVPKSYLFNKFFLEFKAKLRRFEPWAD